MVPLVADGSSTDGGCGHGEAEGEDEGGVEGLEGDHGEAGEGAEGPEGGAREEAAGGRRDRVRGLSGTAASAVALLRATAPRYIVAFSGGKDSLACLSLAVEAGAEVRPFFMEMVPGLDLFEKPLRAVERRLGVTVERVPHWDLSRLLRNSVLRPYSPAAANAPRVTLGMIEAAQRHKHEAEWVVYGHRRGEGMARLGMLKKGGLRQDGPRRLYPIGDWSASSVYAYLRHKRLLTLASSMPRGLTLMPDRLAWLREHHPADFKRVLAVFPFAEVQLRRNFDGLAEKVRGRERAVCRDARARKRAALAVPAVRDGEGGAGGPEGGAVQPAEDHETGGEGAP